MRNAYAPKNEMSDFMGYSIIGGLAFIGFFILSIIFGDKTGVIPYLPLAQGAK